MIQLRRRAFLVGSLSLAVPGCRSTSGDDAPGPFLAPSALAARIDDIKSGKIVVFYVGPAVLFGRGRVPGARNIGEAGESSGARSLSAALAAVPPATEIVVYCGCCPYRSCPNLRPASAALRALGRSNAHFLDLPTRFSTDWSDKGYPVERGPTS